MAALREVFLFCKCKVSDYSLAFCFLYGVPGSCLGFRNSCSSEAYDALMLIIEYLCTEF